MTQPVFGMTINRTAESVAIPVYSDLSVIGLIGTAPNAVADTKASLLTGVIASNTALVWTSKLVGELGNQISVRLVAPSGANQTLGVVVAGNAITVNLATGASAGVATSTAAQVIAAIAASTAANALVGVASQAGSTGAGILGALAAVNLAGGINEPYPINEPAMLFSSDSAALERLGAAGSLRPAIDLINAQLGEFNSSAVVVVVRVAQGGDDTATIASIVGNGTSTGISAFLRAAAKLGVTPRLIAAPGFTHQRTGSNANAVCAALPAVLSKLLATAVVDGPATTLQAALDWRETIASERIVAVDPSVLMTIGAAVEVEPLSPAILGLAVRRDNEFGGRPFHSWANQPVYGIVGPSRPIDFSLTDGATEGQMLLSKNIGILMRSEMGVSGSLGNGGFIFVGTDNCGADELWRFYSVTRGRDYIHLMLLNTLSRFLGKFNITGQTIQAIINTMEAGLRDIKATGDILGYSVQFVADLNSPEDLRAGKIVVNFEAEEAPVLRHLTINSGRMRAAVEALIADIATA